MMCSCKAVEELKSVLIAEQCRTFRVIGQVAEKFEIQGLGTRDHRPRLETKSVYSLWSTVTGLSRLKGAIMARVTVEDCLEKVDNRFLLVMLSAKRVKQLYKGAKPLIENRADNKNVVISLREIAAGKVNFEISSRKSR